MNPNVSVPRPDLEQVVDYLEGLGVILKQLAAEERGLEGGDLLVSQLDELAHGEGSSLYDPGTWAPIRYQVGVGQGFAFLAENVLGLRHKLLGLPGASL